MNEGTEQEQRDCLYICVYQRTKETISFSSYVCLSTGILSLLTVRLPLPITDTVMCFVYCSCPFFRFSLHLCRYCFYPRAFNFPFAVQQNATKVYFIDRFVCVCVFIYIVCSLFSISALEAAAVDVTCRTVYRFHCRSEESRYSHNNTLYAIKNKPSGKRKKRVQTNWRNATKPKIRNENFSFNFLGIFFPPHSMYVCVCVLSRLPFVCFIVLCVCMRLSNCLFSFIFSRWPNVFFPDRSHNPSPPNNWQYIFNKRNNN